MARATVVRYEESAQQPTDGTQQIECYTIYSGTDMLNGTETVGLPVVIDPNNSIPNIAADIAASVRAHADTIANTSNGSGVTIPANNVLILGLAKA